MARTKQTARKSVGGPQATKVKTHKVWSVPPASVPSVTPSSTTTVEERDGQTASGGKRKCDGTGSGDEMDGQACRVPGGGKRGEPIEM
jgi:hypothetical protein